MIDEKKRLSYRIDKDSLPENFPTHAHSAEFWDQLGRAVATFGFLEDTLARAIFALTGTRGHHSKEECEAAFNEWIEAQEKLLSDTLGPLIDKYKKAAATYPGFTTKNSDELISNLRKVAEIRNVLDHACWDRFPDENGVTIPRAFHHKKGRFTAPVDIKYLISVRKFTAEVACEVMNTISHMGWQFPGTNGPGMSIWKVIPP